MIVVFASFGMFAGMCLTAFVIGLAWPSCRRK